MSATFHKAHIFIFPNLLLLIHDFVYEPLNRENSTSKALYRKCMFRSYTRLFMHLQMNGDTIDVSNSVAHQTRKIPSRNIFVDGLGIGDVESIVLPVSFLHTKGFS
jgi:mRNA degradation ribonuclease J1/J2